MKIPKSSILFPIILLSIGIASAVVLSKWGSHGSTGIFRNGIERTKTLDGKAAKVSHRHLMAGDRGLALSHSGQQDELITFESLYQQLLERSQNEEIPRDALVSLFEEQIRKIPNLEDRWRLASEFLSRSEQSRVFHTMFSNDDYRVSNLPLFEKILAEVTPGALEDSRTGKMSPPLILVLPVVTRLRWMSGDAYHAGTLIAATKPELASYGYPDLSMFGDEDIFIEDVEDYLRGVRESSSDVLIPIAESALLRGLEQRYDDVTSFVEFARDLGIDWGTVVAGALPKVNDTQDAVDLARLLSKAQGYGFEERRAVGLLGASAGRPEISAGGAVEAGQLLPHELQDVFFTNLGEAFSEYKDGTRRIGELLADKRLTAAQRQATLKGWKERSE